MKTKLTDVMDEFGVTDCIIAGLGRLVDEEKALDILEMLDKWRVVINRRSTTRHGQCDYNKKQIEIHITALKEGNEAARDQTIVHEIAHAIVPLIYGHGVRGHGREWKRVMQMFGASPDRCGGNDEMKAFKMDRAKIIYGCTSCDVELPAQRKKKHPPETYIHKKCGGHLYLKHDRVTGYRAPQPA